MSDEVKVEQGGVLDNVNIADLRQAAGEQQAATTEKKDDIFDFGDDKAAPVAPVVVPDSVPTPMMPTPSEPTKEDIGGGIIIENEPESPAQSSGPVVGPLTNGSATDVAIQEKMKDLDQMTKIARDIAIAKGQVVKKPDETVVQILIDKTGISSVVFTEEEKQKMTVSKKINVVEINDVELNTIKVSRPKALKAKTLIQRTFEKQYAPFVAVASGYLGKLRNLSSLEIVNLVSINENTKNSAEALLQKASLIFSKIKEASIGEFATFDDFCKQTAAIDMNVMLHALIRATYPEEEEILMNCGNAECTHEVFDKQSRRKVQAPNQFNHKYKNTEVLLGHLITEKVAAETQRILDASYNQEDAIAAQEGALVNTSHRFACGDDKNILVDIYCPSIHDMVENVAKKISPADFNNADAYAPAISMASFVKAIYIRNEDGGYDMFDEIRNIVETIYNMDDEYLDVLSELIQQYVLDFQYKYGFKADTVVCPHCGHALKEDAIIEIENLLFIQAQRHMTKG